MADRIVRYWIKIESHEGNAKSLAAINKSASTAVRSAEKERSKVQRKSADDSTRIQDGLTKANQRELAKRGNDLKRQLAKDDRTREKAVKDAARLDAKETQEALRAGAAAAKERTRIIDRETKAQERARVKADRERERSLKKRVATEKRLQSELNRATAKIETSRTQAIEGFASGTESVARFARGFTMLGLVGEESQQKLLQGLVKMQATFDLVVGGVNSIVRIRKAVMGYMAVVEATSKAEALRRKQNITLINAETVAEVRLAQARGVSAAAGGVGRSATGGVVKSTGRSVTEGAAGGVAVTKGGTIAATAVWLAQLAAVALVITEVAQGFRRLAGDTSKSAESISGSIFGYVKALKASGKAAENTARKEKNRTINLGKKQWMEMRAGIPQAAAAEGRMLQISSAMARETTSPQQRLLALASAQTHARAGVADIAGQTGGGEERLTQRRDELVAIRNKEVEINRERLSAQKEINQTRIEGAQRARELAEQELELAKQQTREAEGRLMSAAERFGRMSPEEQANVIRVKRKADEQGTMALTRAERGIMQGVGTESAAGIARAGDLQSAFEGGFYGEFGASERRDMQAGRKRQEGLPITIEDNRKIEIEVERQEDELAERVASRINDLFAARDRIFAEKIEAKVSSRFDDLDSRTYEELAQQRGATIGR